MWESWKPLWGKDFGVVMRTIIIACLYCEIVLVSTMPHGSIFSCPKDGGGHKPLNSAAAKYAARVLWTPRREIEDDEDSLLPNRLLRSPEQGANLWQSDQVATSLRSANTEGGLLLQSERPIFFWPSIRTQKRLQFALTDKLQASLTLDFFRLTLAAPAYSMGTAIHIERKSYVFIKYNLGFDSTGNPQKVCGAANLQRGVESIHNLQNTVHYQIPRRFS